MTKCPKASGHGHQNTHDMKAALPFVLMLGSNFASSPTKTVYKTIGTKTVYEVESSIYLVKQLGVRSDPKKGGTDKDIVYFMFKNSGDRKVNSNEEIEAIGKSKLTKEAIMGMIFHHQFSIINTFPASTIPPSRHRR